MIRTEDITVLLVDDEQSYVDTLAQRLRMRHLSVSAAYSGEEALALLIDHVPDVMVLDLKMPGIQGMDVLRAVRKRNLPLPVIILSGHGSEREAKEAEDLGGFAFLSKPVEIDSLVQKIREARQSSC